VMPLETKLFIQAEDRCLWSFNVDIRVDCLEFRSFRKI
jgi:hypothetical protein